MTFYADPIQEVMAYFVVRSFNLEEGTKIIKATQNSVDF